MTTRALPAGAPVARARGALIETPSARVRVPGSDWTPKRWLVTALDVVILAYATSLTVIAITGGARVGPISLHDSAKPILVLLLLVPLRLTLGEWPWRARWLALRARHVGALAAARMRPDVADVAFALAVTGVATLVIGFLANLLFRPVRVRAFTLPFAQAKVAEVFAAWDSGWYFDIARRGYYFHADGQSSVAFFPLYPLVMRAVAWPFGGGDVALWIAGIAVSCAAFAAALLVLHQLTEMVVGDRESARRTVLYIALFPFALFFTRVYSESLFLLLTVLAIRAALQDRFWPGAVWGALATLTRPNGILIGLPLGLLAMRGWPAMSAMARRLLPLTLIPLALLGYCAYVYTLAGDPMAWLNAQQHWNYSIGHPPWRLLEKLIEQIVAYGPYDYFLISKMAPFRLIHGLTGLAVLMLAPLVFKRLGVAMGAYVLASVLVPLSSTALEGIGRYTAVLFPLFMVAGGFRGARLHEGIVVVMSLFLALLSALFVTVQPIY